MTALQKPIKGIFFDLGWTLMVPVSGDWMFSNLARRYFGREKLDALPAERVKAALVSAMHYLDMNHLVPDIQTEHALFLRYYTLLSDALPELGLTPEQLRETADDKVYNLENYALFPDSVETLETLCGAYRLGIISDTWPSIEPVLEKFGLKKYFSAITYSYTHGVYKPNPTMYEDALSKMGLPPAQTVFIDDFSGNLRGARDAGMQGVLIRAKPDSDPCDEFPVIEKISGISALL